MAIANLQAIILAAGKSSRCKTGKTKLIEKICGQEMILYPTTLLDTMNIPITVVIGFQKDKIKDVIINKHGHDTIHFVTQAEQQGTGHAILCARNSWEKELILVMNGDIPLITQEIITTLYEKHVASNAVISFVTAHNIEPTIDSYSRIIKKNDGIDIVEAKNFTGDTHEHCCINAGIYIINKDFLEKYIDDIEENEATKEFYFTDLIKIASNKNYPIATISTSFDRIRGINNFQELWAAEQIKRAELIKYWMEHGVRFAVAQNVHIDLNVTIGSGTHIGCGTHLQYGTKIGKNCAINAFSSLTNTVIGDHTTIDTHSIISNSRIGSHVHIGPFAHVHNNSTIEDNAVIGNFVEVKRSVINKYTKAKHLTYLGDAHIGEHVNIGAGSITCNHNGTSKNKTVIEDNAYIGSNNTLIAPVTIKKNAFTAAGSVITETVPENALAIARARQVNKKDYAKKLRKQPSAKTSTTKDSSSIFVAAVKTNNNNSTTSEEL